MDERRHRRGLVGPLLLIGLGVVFLLNNMGQLNWSVWDLIFKLWPVLLIAVGLDIVIGRSSIWGSLVTILLIVGVVAIGVWTMKSDRGAFVRSGESLSFPLLQARRAEVRLSPGVGVIHLAGSAAPADLLSGTTWTGGGLSLAREFNNQVDVATLNLHAEGSGVLFPVTGPPGEPSWDVHLTSAIPVDLGVDLGVGQSVLDLRGVQLSALNVDQGIGQLVVQLPRNANLQADLSMAIGETIVVIPPGVGARLHLSTGIAARSVPPSYTREGDTYTSPNYATATDKVNLNVSVAIGNLSVREGSE
jgi:hypothetical protein